jgi:RHS repeat-associated protein
VDTQGRVLEEQVPTLEPVRFTYDGRGRLSTLTHGSGVGARVSTLTYNPQGFLGTLTDPLSRTVQFTYDAAGRVTTQTLPDGRVLTSTYDANGNVASITPPSRPAHAFTYTPLDLEGSYDPPDVGVSPDATTYAYNLDRQLTTITRPDGTTVTLAYDPGGRLSSLTLPRGPLSYTYQPTTGQLTTLTAPDSGTLAYTYNGSLLTSSTWTGPVAGSVSRTYDTDFRLASESVNGATPIAFTYDADSLLTAAGALSLTRDPQHGLLTGSTLGNVSDTRSYSSFGELSSYAATVSDSPVFQVAYTRDVLGRISEKTETIQGVPTTTAYAYDPAGRLTDVTLDGSLVAHYEYDANGNRLSVTRPTGPVMGTYDAQDRLLTYGGLTYTYTANGELQTATSGTQITTYTYDPLGNLVSVALPTGTQLEYVIDGQNRRVGKRVNGSLVQGFLYRNQLNPIAELDGAGNVVSRFIYASKPHVPDYLVKGGTTYRILSDHLGSPRLIVDTSTGALAQRLDYDEFGQITLDTNPGFQPFGFAGGLLDPDTGLLRFGARDYDAFTGRWTTKDPIEFLGGDTNLYGYVDSVGKPLETNLYAYVGGDPIGFVDPMGLKLSSGVSLSLSTINPVSSGGGGVWGYNYQSVPGARCSQYLYSGSGVGLDVGASIQSVWAWGEGEWAGEFRSVNVNFLVLSGSVFWSPGSGGWTGFTFGLGAGLPGLAYQETNYRYWESLCPCQP